MTADKTASRLVEPGRLAVNRSLSERGGRGQLQNQAIMTKKKVVHATGLPTPTMNCITGLSFRLIMSVTS